MNKGQFSVVMAGLDPAIHHLRKKNSHEVDGLHRTSGLPEVRTNECRKWGKTRLAVSSPAMTAEVIACA
jgi:hypothetical protein